MVHLTEPGAKDMNIDRLIQQMDTNHDGKIQYEAWVCSLKMEKPWHLKLGNARSTRF